MRRKFKFDQLYYKKWYEDDKSRTFSREFTAVAVRFVMAYIDYCNLELNNVLDVGCGLGYWKRELDKTGKDIRYKGLEISNYLCSRYGWEKNSIVDYVSDEKFDLVVCQDVLQYLDDEECIKAIENMAMLCSGALYLDVLTDQDLRKICLIERTDIETYVRSGNWYLKGVSKHFTSLGGGFFIRNGIDVQLYELWVH